jgi:hypothetical protein
MTLWQDTYASTYDALENNPDLFSDSPHAHVYRKPKLWALPFLRIRLLSRPCMQFTGMPTFGRSQRSLTRNGRIKNSVSRPGRCLLCIAACKSIRYVLCTLIRPAHIFCVGYRSFLPRLVAEFPTILFRKHT